MNWPFPLPTAMCARPDVYAGNRTGEGCEITLEQCIPRTVHALRFVLFDFALVLVHFTHNFDSCFAGTGLKILYECHRKDKEYWCILCRWIDKRYDIELWTVIIGNNTSCYI